MTEQAEQVDWDQELAVLIERLTNMTEDPLVVYSDDNIAFDWWIEPTTKLILDMTSVVTISIRRYSISSDGGEMSISPMDKVLYRGQNVEEIVNTLQTLIYTSPGLIRLRHPSCQSVSSRKNR